MPAPEHTLKMPVTGIEAELAVFAGGERVDPARLWTSPSALMGPAAVPATGPAAPLAAGGVVYFDDGVAEIVTPVIELGPGATARAVRNLWEGMEQVAGRLEAWAEASGRSVRLQGFSTHYNVSFTPPAEEGRPRTADALALLLAHLLPFPVALVGGNRRSTGVGVRPRGNRIEVTFDFTPDPGLMIATATLVVGIVRGAMTLPSYDLAALADHGLPTVAGVVPGKHSSRRGWLARDYDFPRSPFTTNVDARVWPVRDGRLLSLRAIARETAWFFRRTLRQHSDPFSFRLLFSILEGQAPSLLELPDRPAAYDDVGRAIRWGQVLPQLQAEPSQRHWEVVGAAAWSEGSFEAHVRARARARERARRRAAREAQRAGADRLRAVVSPPAVTAQGRRLAVSAPPRRAAEGYRGDDRRAFVPDLEVIAAAPDVDRRVRPALLERRIRGGRPVAVPFPDRYLTRSRYEQVFLRLVAGTPMVVGGQTYRPVKMRGWYHAVFAGPGGEERELSIDDLLAPEVEWLPPLSEIQGA